MCGWKLRTIFVTLLVIKPSVLHGVDVIDNEDLILPNGIDPSSSSTLISNNTKSLTPVNANPKSSKVQLSTEPIFIVVSYDGFRYDYFSKTNTPHLNSVKENGVSAAYMKNQFPTKTYPNHQSIATGLHPESHGIIDNKFFDPDFNKYLGVADEDFWVYSSDVVPLWILNEWNGGVSGSMMWPGSCFAYGKNKTKPTYCQDWDNSINFENRVDTAIQWLTNDTNPANLIFFYFEEPDEHGHGFGPNSNEVKNFIERMDNVTGYLLERLRTLEILDKVNLLFLSDHGFEQVEQNHIINVSAIVNPNRYKTYGGSPTYLILPNQDEDVDLMYKEFKTGSVGRNFTAFKKDTIDTERPHWFYSNNRRIMPIVLVADLGFVFDDFYNSMTYYDKKYNVTHTSSRVYGSHGYNNDLMPMLPFFRAQGPVFRSGVEIDPFQNIDIFPLLCHLLNIPTPPNNASIIQVEMLLFRHGYHVGTPVAWIIGSGVVIGLIILLGILSLLVNRYRRSHYSSDFGQPNVGYRFVNYDDGDSGYDENSRLGVVSLEFDANRTQNNSEMENRALLRLSLSDDSISSTENQIV